MGGRTKAQPASDRMADEATVAQLLAEMQRYSERMQDVRIEIDRLRAESLLLKAETDRLRAESLLLKAETDRLRSESLPVLARLAAAH